MSHPNKTPTYAQLFIKEVEEDRANLNLETQNTECLRRLIAITERFVLTTNARAELIYMSDKMPQQEMEEIRKYCADLSNKMRDDLIARIQAEAPAS